MTKNVLTVMGALLAMVGILGFGAPSLFGMHLGPVHNVIHLVSGGAALYFGLGGTRSAARTFSLVFGVIYALLGLIGLMAGGIHGTWTVIPNQLVLGPPDHIVHLVIGTVLFLVSLEKPTRLASPHRDP